jgi:hypothetical protein
LRIGDVIASVFFFVRWFVGRFVVRWDRHTLCQAWVLALAGAAWQCVWLLLFPELCCFKKTEAIKTCVSDGGFNCSAEKICFLQSLNCSLLQFFLFLR